MLKTLVRLIAATYSAACGNFLPVSNPAVTPGRRGSLFYVYQCMCDCHTELKGYFLIIIMIRRPTSFDQDSVLLIAV